ncbi:MAG: hypothetical protein PQJ61_16595 [Spirochaetales bacterium]|uniref:Uncharacterized protein n=1 Tax=Candidatus Thalassospirochaeta sargassi TaxID=3119039 RepID=A0AAJ1IHS0_9SPIO|nr:hypothetical protein [Spirochaetales bacterium]
MKKILFLTFFIFISILGYSENFFGVPILKIISSEEGASQATLTDEEMRENVVFIEQNAMGEYIWITRNNTVLNKIESGIYIIFNANNGVGYVKVNSLNGQFIEHVHSGLMTITYYGVEIKDE